MSMTCWAKCKRQPDDRDGDLKDNDDDQEKLDDETMQFVDL